MLEDAVIVPEYKNIFILGAITFFLLAVLLYSARTMSKKYKKTNDTSKKKKKKMQSKYIDKKQKIGDIISREIVEYKCDLAHVKSHIEEWFHQSLGHIDGPYIEGEYIKYCEKFWLQETTNLLKELAESKSLKVFQEIFNSLDSIKGLSQIPNPLNQLESYKLLIKHRKLVCEKKEKTLIKRFKRECLEQIVAFDDSTEKELVFLEKIVDFLCSYKNRQSIIAELGLEDFCNADLSFDTLIDNVMKLEVDEYGENLTVLQEATDGLKGESLFLIDKFNVIIRAHVKPLEMQEREIDGRLVIEVTRISIVASEILQELENKLSENSKLEEVRFVGAEIIHIDADLNNDVWHGKNVVIVAKKIRVYDKVTWDVSGKDNDHIYSNDAGTGEDGHGKQGKDGYAGESGGNVLIYAEEINNAESFTIVSNGGEGSKGEDGGNGSGGKDGVGITRAEFDDKFPSVVKLFAWRGTRKDLDSKTIENMKNDSIIIENWRHNTFMAYDLFVKTKTNHGNIITFSNCGTSQAFLLYEGSQGQSGGYGGEFGLGGQGGYAGEIIIKNPEDNRQEFSIINITKEGKEGEKGKGGKYGSHGKNGCDMGYLDHQLWKNPKFYGRNQESKCTIEFYESDNNPSDRVWCPFKDKYAGIRATNIEHKMQKKYEERKSTRQNNDRQHHARAVRKKNIPQSSILANYSHHLNSIESGMLRNLRCDLESTKQCALQALVENQKQQESQITELRINCLVKSTYQGESKHYKDVIAVTPSIVYRERIDVKILIDKLEKKPLLLLSNWSQFKNMELSLSQLNWLISVFEGLKGDSTEIISTQNGAELQLIEKLLIDKYRLATLQEIAKQLPPYQEVTHNVELKPDSAARYLFEAKENDNNISHAILGTLNQYFYENSEKQRENISKFVLEELQNTENEALKYSIRAFVLEEGKLEGAHTDVKKYYNEHEEFTKKQEHSLNILLEALKSELSQPRHAEILDFWNENIKDTSSMSELEEKIEKDDFLKILYNRFYNQLKQRYDWVECCKDKALLKEYNNYIKIKGPLSGGYRELLAYVFGINIRLYAENQDTKLFLQDDHNPPSNGEKIIHILCRDNKFIPLNIDKNYLKLEEEREKENNLYGQIFTEIKSFKQKQEFDDYLNNKTFLSIKNPSENEQSFNEKENIEKITEYFPEGERQQLKERLNKIASQYIGQHGILHNILKRFFNEGRRVSRQELYCFINSIITSVVEDKNELNIFCWIVAAFSQRSWMDELILLQLENHFKKSIEEKSKWREYLSKIENKDILLLFGVKLEQSCSISTQCVEDILYLLSNTSSGTVSLGGIGLSEWPYALKEKYWMCKLSKLVDWQKGDLSTASYYLLSIDNIFGSLLAEKLIEALEINQQKFRNGWKFFVKNQELSPDTLTEILSHFHNEKWNLSEKELKLLSNQNINEWKKIMKQKFIANEKDRDITRLVELINDGANTTNEISNNLPKIKDYIKSIDKYIIGGKSVDCFTETDIKNWAKKIQGNIDEGNQDVDQKMLAVIERAIVLTKKIKLRDTQKLTILALLTNNHNTLAQVSTGEGKSLIVVAVSIMKTLRRGNVHIITSSSVLAKRDAEGNKDIYNLFGINVSHNCSECIEKRKEVYSGNQVIYGDLCNFQRDYLLDRFYGKNILGDCNFDSVIVDEVDSMLLDKGNNMLYLSHNLPGLDKLESVYIYIWQWINRPAIDVEEIAYALDTKAIKKAVMSDLYGLIEKEDIRKLGSELNEQQKDTIWERLVNAEILNNEGKLLKENIDNNKLDEILSPRFNEYKDRVQYLVKEYTERERRIHVPNYLKPFVERHLESWINSAVTAFFMKAGQDYVVDVDRTGTSQDRNPNITILDRDTGTDQANSQWDEALHQFLQLKHGCKLSFQSLKAVFISNVSFFKLYRKLYGLTGTLGSQRERDLLREIHEVDFVTIPTSKSKRFHEDKPIICTSKKEWINHICGGVKKLTEENKRSVLIICEIVNDVEVLHKAFGGKDAKHVHTYTRDYEEFDKGFEIVHGNKELGQGQIIIATNLAGRGTDIKITEGLRKAGGLHVCLTYLPNNIRVEQQAFGRAARSGDQGSGQLIIMDLKGQECSISKIFDLKKNRDSEELHRISDIKAYYETQISIEESCFKKFKEQYEELKKDLDDDKVPTEIKEILLQSCLDKWAYWLDENNKNIRNFKDEQSKRNFNSLLNKFILQLKSLDTGCKKKSCITPFTNCEQALITLLCGYDSKSWLAWVEGNPVQMVKLGRYLSQNNKHENAIQIFNNVVASEPYFSEAAHYYKAFALAKKIDWQQKLLDETLLEEFKKELQETARLLEQHSNFSMSAASVIGKIKKNNNESIIQIDSYEEQQKGMANLYYMFSQTVNDISGHLVTPQSFVNDAINENLAQDLYETLLEEGVLKKPSIKKSISEKELKVICSDYGISVQELKDFLSKYEGKEFDVKEFLKSLKRNIKLPGQEGLWKLLIQEKVLSEEVKYVMCDNEKLKDVDFSLLDYLTKEIKEGKLIKQTLKANDKQILLYVEWITQQKNNYNVFTKGDFVNIIGKEKYKTLKERGVLSFNKIAHVNLSKTESTVLSDYDSITIEDLTNKANFTESEAEKILAELADRGVLEKDPKNGIYRLKIKFDEIEQKVQLSFCPVYENAVKGLLSIRFIYRKALQKISRQMKEKNSPIRLQLTTKPHQNLFFELLEQRIIKPVRVARKDKDLIEKIVQNKLQSMEEKIIKNIRSLLKEKYLKRKRTNNEPTLIGMMNKHKLGLSGEIIKSIIEWTNSIGDDLELELKVKEASKELQLTNENTIKNVIKTLEQSKGLLKAVEVPDIKLKPFTKLCSQGEFENTEEIYVFSLNGLDQFLQLEEKKWTRKMILSTAVVTAIGISQIVIGTAIELFSAGVMTHVGAAFLNEGVNDLFYAAGAFKSGHFSWNDYGQHKRQSVIMTVATAGIGALFSTGVKFSRFGHKLAGPVFEKTGKKVAEISGTQLIEIAGRRVVGKEFVKRITLKAVEGIAFGLANEGVDILIENYLQGLCDGIASSILSNIEQKVEKHNISANLKEIYETLEDEKAKKKLNDMTKRAFAERNCVEKYLPIVKKISSCVTQGISKAAEKGSATSQKYIIPINTISKTVLWSERIDHIAAITRITGELLNDLDEKIKNELKKHAKKKHVEKKRQQEETEKSYENFKKDFIDQWKSLLCERAGQVISQHILSPILKEGANHLITCAGKKVQELYQSYKENEYSEYFEKRKQEYHAALQDSSEQQSNNTSQMENSTTAKYHEDLLKLLKTTRNPELFAAIIREGIPMDMTCVSASTKIIQNILKTRGIENLTIVVEGDGDIRQKFPTGKPENGVDEIIVELKLKDHHFQFHETNTLENNQHVESNNCLYNALSDALPGLRDRITAEEFRNEAANCITRDEEIKYHIRNGWHELPISLGAYGGRKASNFEPDEESSTFDEKIHGTYENYKYRICDIRKHFSSRFERFIRLGGMVQRISEETKTPRNKIVKGGASQFQDKNSRRKHAYHASHIVRAVLSPKLESEFENQHHELKTFLGKTQIVESWANIGAIGKHIDKWQEKNIKKLLTIDFNKSLTTEDASTIKDLTDSYMKIINKQINNGKLNDTNKLKFNEIKGIFTDIKMDSVHEYGRKGYGRFYHKEC